MKAFRLTLKNQGIILNALGGRIATLVKIEGKNTIFEVQIPEELEFRRAQKWISKYVAGIDSIEYPLRIEDIISSLRVLDLLLERQVIPYADKIFMLIACASILKTVPQKPEAEIIGAFMPRVVARYRTDLVSTLLSTPLVISTLLEGVTPNVALAIAEAILSLERRNAIFFEVVT